MAVLPSEDAVGLDLVETTVNDLKQTLSLRSGTKLDVMLFVAFIT